MIRSRKASTNNRSNCFINFCSWVERNHKATPETICKCIGYNKKESANQNLLNSSEKLSWLILGHHNFKRKMLRQRW